jgi:soluble lytic murein transglycosylase-like protein
MPSCRLLAAAVLLWACGWTTAEARESVLYRCNASDGSVAYTSSRQGYSDCKAIATYAAAPAPAATPASAAPASPPPAEPATGPTRRGWRYEENPPARADFQAVSAMAATTAPAAGLPEPTAPAAVPATAPAAAPLVVAKAKPSSRILRGAVYKVERKGGITEYTNVKPRGSAFSVLFTYIATCVACDLHSTIDFARTALNLDAYKDEIAAAAADYGVDGSLLRAVIHAESAFNPMAMSAKGAQGLMQLMPGTADDLGVADAFDAAQNIRGGARYLAQLLKNFNGDAQLATAACNAGPGAVQKYGGVPPYDETQVYVQRVATLRDRYAKAM